MKESDSKIQACFSILRMHHWVKNTFVIAPLIFSISYKNATSCINSLLAFVSFSLISSAVYIINDIFDIEADRQHPLKRHRPLASGRMLAKEAFVLCVVLVLMSLLIGYKLGGWFTIYVFGYFIMNILYSVRLKHIAVIDVMIIAAGFELRIIAGSVAISVVPSHWLLLCTVMLAMFLGFTKRRTELIRISTSQDQGRKVLKDYSAKFLDQVIAMITAVTLVCYSLYAVDAKTISQFNTQGMLLTVPFVMYGLFRYIYIIYYLEEQEDPSQILYKDWPLIINIILWLIVVFFVVNYGSRFLGGF